MAAKEKPNRLESQIEKYRAEANWGKVQDLAKQLYTKQPKFEYYVQFLDTESRLERYLIDKPSNDKTPPDLSSEELRKMQQDFIGLLSVDTKDTKDGMKQEILMMLAKVHYIIGEYDIALIRLVELNPDKIETISANIRRLKMLGESFAVKGLAMEKLPLELRKKFPQFSDWDAIILESFEKAGDISLSVLHVRQDSEKGSKANLSSTTSLWPSEPETASVGPFVEVAIQRCPLHYIRNGDLNKGIDRLRQTLRVVETKGIQSLRQILSRQLAEVLLRGVCDNTYVRLKTESSESLVTNNGTKTLRPRLYIGSRFTPESLDEEILLLLFVSESIASREVILNMSPELQDLRKPTFNNAVSVFDLLTVALVRYGQFLILSSVFDRALRFSFEEFHVWYQFGLTLVSSEKYLRAYLVFKECLRLQPSNVTVHMLCAKLCYEQLDRIDDGLKHAQTIVDGGERSQPLLARGHVALGIGYSIKGTAARLLATKQDLQKKALQCFKTAVSLDYQDYLAVFHLALHLASLRQITEALRCTKRALMLRQSYAPAQHLLALLLSSQKKYEEALELMKMAVHEFPDNLNLLFTLSKLVEVVSSSSDALASSQHLLEVWKRLFEPIVDDEQKGTGLINKVTSSDHRSLVQLQLAEFSDRDSAMEVGVDNSFQSGVSERSPIRTINMSPSYGARLSAIPSYIFDNGSVRADSQAASRVEQTLSEVASSLGSFIPQKQGPRQCWLLQVQIWLHIADLYIRVPNLDAAHACIQEATSIFPINHMISYMRGRLYEAKGQYKEATQCYENAIALNPWYTKALVQLGYVLLLQNNTRLAEKTMRDAVNSDTTCHQAWHILGKVLAAQGDHEAASDCFFTALDLEETSPVVSFSAIPRLLP